jgi:D-alanyl-D-alanine carboxypeptidase/D-alanyl-D-alanine-endopeptidase (penicillin-binding protein 4)
LRRFTAWIALALCASIAQAQTLPAARWPEPVRAALQRAEVPLDALAVVVLPTSRLGPRWLHQPDKPMQPASTMKLVTSVVALDRLGITHRGFTELLSAAPQDGEVLRGDLVLRGGADPELGLPQLWELLAELRYRGIREIAGDIVLDRNLFRPARMDLGLPPFDEQPEFPYNVIPDALHMAGSLMGVEINSMAGSVSARLLPPLPGIELDAGAMTLTDRACKDWDDDWQSPPQLSTDANSGTTRIALRGGFPKQCSVRTELQLLDRNLQAQAQLRWLWQQLGGQWSGQVREGATPPGARQLGKRLSRPWGEMLRPMNKRSDNAYTRLLYLSLGLAGMAAHPQTTTSELARQAVLRWFAEHRIDTAGLVLDNGSGLSRSERITPRQLAQLLLDAHLGRQAPDLWMSMPVVGVDGTMRNRLKTGPAAGLARLKTGTLRNVVALAGYVPDARGRVWVMAAMVNHGHADKARPALDALVEWLAVAGPTNAAQRQAPGPQGEAP